MGWVVFWDWLGLSGTEIRRGWVSDTRLGGGGSGIRN